MVRNDPGLLIRPSVSSLNIQKLHASFFSKLGGAVVA